MNDTAPTTDGTRLNEFIIMGCLGRYPCMPDLDDPIVSITYVAERFLCLKGKKKRGELTAIAERLEIVAVTICRQPCIRVSDVMKLVEAENRVKSPEISSTDVSPLETRQHAD